MILAGAAAGNPDSGLTSLQTLEAEWATFLTRDDFFKPQPAFVGSILEDLVDELNSKPDGQAPTSATLGPDLDKISALLATPTLRTYRWLIRELLSSRVDRGLPQHPQARDWWVGWALELRPTGPFGKPSLWNRLAAYSQTGTEVLVADAVANPDTYAPDAGALVDAGNDRVYWIVRGAAFLASGETEVTTTRTPVLPIPHGTGLGLPKVPRGDHLLAEQTTPNDVWTGGVHRARAAPSGASRAAVSADEGAAGRDVTARVLTWAVRKSDPIAAVGGVWFSAFLVPVGTVLHFEGSPIGLQHLYIPFFGLLLGSVRLLTRSVERALNYLRNKPLRFAVEGTLTIVLLWSLAPLIDTCSRSVASWTDATSLYVDARELSPQRRGARALDTRAVSTSKLQPLAARAARLRRRAG